MTHSSEKPEQPSGSAPAQKPSTSVHPVEPSTDPHHGQAALNNESQQRDLRTNTETHQGEQHPATPAGQHATGSFPSGSGEDRKSK